MVMDSQEQGFHSKRVAGIARDTELCTSWAAQNDLAAYGVVDNQRQPIASHSRDIGMAVGSYHPFPSGSTEFEIQWSSLIAHRSTCALSEDTLQQKMLVPSCRHFGAQMRNALTVAVPRPPVTTATLIELDLNWILHNMNLRSDINFENDLHFMPVKGKRAEQKRKEAQEYWLALAAELQIHLHACNEYPSKGSEGAYARERFTPRLAQMFTDLRELLETLIPDRDHVSIAENLDVPFVMQQIENGVLDISRVARWLASLLKSHCAPMRDEWADQMTQQIEEGAGKSDMVLLVKGIEKLFSVLEAMKLVILFNAPP